MASANPRPDDDSLDVALAEFLEELGLADTKQLEAMTNESATHALEEHHP